MRFSSVLASGKPFVKSFMLFFPLYQTTVWNTFENKRHFRKHKHKNQETRNKSIRNICKDLKINLGSSDSVYMIMAYFISNQRIFTISGPWTVVAAIGTKPPVFALLKAGKIHSGQRGYHTVPSPPPAPPAPPAVWRRGSSWTWWGSSTASSAPPTGWTTLTSTTTAVTTWLSSTRHSWAGMMTTVWATVTM